MSLPPSPLEALLTRLLGEITSQTLALDPTSHPRLAAMQGQSVRFDILPPALPGRAGAEPRTMLVTVQEEGLNLEAGSTANAHAVVRGELPAIVRMLFATTGPDKKANAPEAGAGAGPGAEATVRIEGDEAVLQAIASLFRDLQPDLAAPLARAIGRDAADNLVGAAEAGFAFLRSAAESLAAGARKEAQDAWVTESAQDSLLDRLDDLKLRVDRLDARVGLAERRAAESGP